MKNKIKVLMICVCGLFYGTITQGQNTDDKGYEPEMTNRERILLGTYFSSPYISNNINATQFGVGLQPFVGWRLNEYIASGLTFRFDYLYLWSINGNQSFTDFSTTAFARATVAEVVIFQVEGGLYSNQSLFSSTQKVRNNFPVAYAGIGFSRGRWEFLLQAEITGNLARYRLPFDYKLGVTFPL